MDVRTEELEGQTVLGVEAKRILSNEPLGFKDSTQKARPQRPFLNASR
jgi:hypothetical protein